MHALWTATTLLASAGALLGVQARPTDGKNHTVQSGYDYIVVGGGPSGIITAERLAEANKSVLLLERSTAGPTVGTGSNYTLSWNDTLTAIDVPGLSFDVGNFPQWSEYICTDTDGTAACILGGGVTVNYMVFVHPPDHDFNDKWPVGWKWANVTAGADRLYARNPGSSVPSADGKLYDQTLFTTLSTFFNNLNWTATDMSAQRNEKFQTYSHPVWNIKDYKRAGPVRTYLPLALQYPNFSLRMGALATRVIRNGSLVTGVEIVNVATNQTETIPLAPGGRVVLSSGALHSPRILFNSGIGPRAQIETAQKSGISVPPTKEWIHLPVGESLMDHPIFSIVIQTDKDFNELDAAAILNGTATSEITAYEEENDGVLTQGKHRLIFFSSNVASDGHTRYYQGSCTPTAEGEVTITTYMTHGLTSKGVLGLDADQRTVIEKSPYLQTAGDREAATTFIQSMVDAINAPGSGFQLVDYTNTSAILGSLTAGIHYAGTTKMGTDDGRFNGTAVVDTNTKVYGTDNLYIVDGGIHPDLASGNNQATIMVVAENAVERILAH
ncbi:FAD/NAD(P)-binding domain-containing protein [Aspergillus uvarum CBS 121591]|uniref:FAD/NAD(P)-binding domain-containing protein n=1 Tax=Aspergillus uvarum CBS 121591 TaxID=1448315 RepID=A0A319DJI5_9EURO|nr:FAD/NAD(P)-binding domain-containing protein [Aspergillus uvarum CBS 121591]PYH79602.1 FAD/NAD(P)-binding domain-containing protein [Aspergillus uvarum CBS 121591]